MSLQRTAQLATATETIVQLARAAKPQCGETTVIAIDGRSASGKTTLADAAAAALGGAAIVHLEDLYGGWNGLAHGALRLQVDGLMPISTGQAANLPSYDWTAGSWREGLTLDSPEFLIVEGCGAGSLELATWTSVLVWIEADEATRKARASQRADWSQFEPKWADWELQEDEHVALNGPASRADLLVTD